MADSNLTPVLSVCATVGSKLPELVIKDGQLIFVKDKRTIALDIGGKRTFYTQIEELATEAARTSLLAPVTGLYYFVVETSVLWTYRDGWVQITTPPQKVTPFPIDAKWYFDSLALAKAAAATAEEMGSSNSAYYFGMKLLVYDGTSSKWYTIQKGGTLLEEGVSFTTDNTLILENGVLRVNTTNEVAADNTLPITSAAVYTQVGNIEVLLNTI